MSELLIELKNSKSIVFCSFDAGGAEQLSSFILNNQLTGKFLVSGPALKIFENKKLISERDLILEIPSETEILFSSTGTTDYEFRHMKVSLERGIHTIVILDHWVNFRERFIRNGFRIIPNVTLVVDEISKKKAENVLTGHQIIQVNNFFLEDIKKSYAELSENFFEYDYLFICESRNELTNIEQSTKNDNFDGLEYFFDLLQNRNQENSKILIRPHPSDLNRDYRILIPETFPNVVIDSNQSLLSSLKISRIIVGCNSMALVIAQTVGKQVFSALTKGALNHLDHFEFKLIEELPKPLN